MELKNVILVLYQISTAASYLRYNCGKRQKAFCSSPCMLHPRAAVSFVSCIFPGLSEIKRHLARKPITLKAKFLPDIVGNLNCKDMMAYIRLCHYSMKDLL